MTASRAARAPISGFATAAVIDNGWVTNALFGQSYQVGGENSFASPDYVHVGAYSGLETPTSDYVGLVGFASPVRPVGFGERDVSTSRVSKCADRRQRPATRRACSV